MQPVVSRKKIFQRQIPTLVGLAILVVALAAGVLFIGDGLGVFAPRATPQTTPKSIRVSNVTDTGFTISFLTDEATTGFVKYGTENNRLSSQASDDRDQLSGSVGSFTLHHITVRGLQPSTEYFSTLGTGSQAEFDNNGAPFTITTAKRAGAPAAAKTVYGNVTTASGGPADGSVVYISVEGVGDMSSLVKSSGSWAVPLSNARTKDGSAYASIDDSTLLTLNVQGPTANDTSQASVLVSDAQPVAAITLGEDGALASDIPVEDQEKAVIEEDDEVILTMLPSPTPTVAPASGGLSELAQSTTPVATGSSTTTTATSSATSSVVDLDVPAKPTVDTTQPKIVGSALPNVVVTISVHSETQIEQQLTADEDGNFELDIATLSQQLEPGEHTVQYSYVDPATGNTVTKNKTFTVASNAKTNTLLAQAQPFGSGNPVPVGASPTPSPSPSPTVTPVATSSGTTTSTSSATTSGKGGTASRSSQVATGSALPTAGSVSTTFALLFGGVFFIIAGGWSWWISTQLKEEF